MDNRDLHLHLISSLNLIIQQVEQSFNESHNISVLDLDLLRRKTQDFYLILEETRALKLQTTVSMINETEENKLKKNNFKQADDFSPDPLSQISMDEEMHNFLKEQKRKMFVEEFGELEVFAASMPELAVKKKEEIKEDQALVSRLRNMQSATHPIEQDLKNPLDIFSSLQTIADKYKGGNPSLHEQIGQNPEKKNSITDLKAAIGINEKFLFINELFKGNVKECTDLILQLNEAGSMHTALNLIQPAKEKYQWEEKTHAYIMFLDFIQRRFPAQI